MTEGEASDSLHQSDLSEASNYSVQYQPDLSGSEQQQQGAHVVEKLSGDVGDEGGRLQPPLL